MDKRINKKTGEELQQFLAFRKRASRVEAKKGKGSYSRAKFKKGEF
jgi:stalled ribosome alternative rescue factor ArfA